MEGCVPLRTTLREGRGLRDRKGETAGGISDKLARRAVPPQRRGLPVRKLSTPMRRDRQVGSQRDVEAAVPPRESRNRPPEVASPIAEERGIGVSPVSVPL